MNEYIRYPTTPVIAEIEINIMAMPNLLSPRAPPESVEIMIEGSRAKDEMRI